MLPLINLCHISVKINNMNMESLMKGFLACEFGLLSNSTMVDDELGFLLWLLSFVQIIHATSMNFSFQCVASTSMIFSLHFCVACYLVIYCEATHYMCCVHNTKKMPSLI